MIPNTIVTADELITLYRDGEKRGFIVGVIFSVTGYALIRKMNREDLRHRFAIKNEHENAK